MLTAYEENPTSHNGSLIQSSLRLIHTIRNLFNPTTLGPSQRLAVCKKTVMQVRRRQHTGNSGERAYSSPERRRDGTCVRPCTSDLQLENA